jgi:HD-GYP domain-containing protein (c-di-GMP phosphodiesterase class II)
MTSTTTLLPLLSGQLKVGAPLPFGVRDAHGKLLLARGQTIGSDTQLQALLARGVFADAAEVQAAEAARGNGEATKKTTLFDLWEHAIWRLERLLASLDQEPDFARRCDEFARQMIELVQRDPDIGIYLSVRQDARRLVHYGLTHSLHCALLCQLTAARMGWSDAAIRSLVKAALTMNAPIIKLQGRLAVHGRLSEAQQAEVRAHPEQAVERLRAAGVDDALWLQAVLEHHERPGGGGYPNGIDQLSPAAGVLRMADVFLAKITPRCERPALSIQEAARQMFSEANGDPAAATIIKEYGIYPPGNVVQLASGEIAIVIRRGSTAFTPLAAAITDKSGISTVNTTRRDTAHPAFAIKSPLIGKPVALRVPPERLYGLAE